MPAHTLHPQLLHADALEPGLLVGVLDERRQLLFDLPPQLAGLPPRVLLRISHAFVTHTHMDHYAGFDHLLAVGLGRQQRLVVWGGPGFVDQVEHKLRAYTWNVVHRYAVPLMLEAHELREDGSRATARFDSRSGFAREDTGANDRPEGDVLLDDETFRVRATFVDHEMPVLAYCIEEKARWRVRPERLAAMGYTAGAWLRRLKQALLAEAPGSTPIELHWRDRAGEHRAVRSVDELRPLVLDAAPGRRIGYVTDLRHTPDNIDRLQRLLADVDVLHIEAVFLDEDEAHARRKNHLTARQAGEIARRLQARALVPFHFSPRYEGRYERVVAEAREAWGGPPEDHREARPAPRLHADAVGG